jgi:3-hydroxyacyl-[acyl-carrier-protein] dehydratase
MSDTMTAAPPVGQLIGLDRILAVEPGRRADAILNVPSTLAIFDSHFPRLPVLPGVIIIGSLARLAEVLLRESTQLRWRLAEAEKVSFRHFVRPGDVMELTVELAECADGKARCTGRAVVDGNRVTTVGGLRLIQPELAGAG